MASFVSGKRTQVRPPEKGSFPLDREGECRRFMQLYLDCMDINKNNHSACKDFSKDYLECRMNRNLMQKEDLDQLGFDAESMEAAKSGKDAQSSWESSNVRTSGFFAGLMGLKKEG